MSPRKKLFASTATTEEIIDDRVPEWDRLSWYRTMWYIRVGYNQECEQPHSYVGRCFKWMIGLLNNLL